MINLIPKEEKKKMIVDFYYRLATLFTVALNLCVLIALISILPAYFISSMKNSSINTKLENKKSEPLLSLEEESLALTKDIDSQLALVKKFEKNKFRLSVNVINAIILKKRYNIKITQILYENDKIKGKKISITGAAPSREVLLSFRKALEDDPTFKNVVLPISNFVKGSDINFFISLNLI